MEVNHYGIKKYVYGVLPTPICNLLVFLILKKQPFLYSKYVLQLVFFSRDKVAIFDYQ